MEASRTTTDRQVGRTIAVVLVLVVVGFGILALLAALDRDTERSTEAFEGVTVLEFDLDSGDISVTADEAADKVVVERSVSVGFLSGTYREEQAGGTLRLERQCPRFIVISVRCEGSYAVTVPVAVAVEGRTSNGPIRIEGVEAVVDVVTSNGRVELAGLSASVRARTSNGAITGIGIDSSDIDVNTSNGRIDLSFGVPPSSVRARSSNGDIEVTLPSDSPPYALATSTSNGRVDTSIRTDPAAGESIDVSTSNGDIIVGYSD